MKPSAERLAAAQTDMAKSEANLAAIEPDPPRDAMRNVYNTVREKLLNETVPLNDRLRLVFKTFRLELDAHRGKMHR